MRRRRENRTNDQGRAFDRTELGLFGEVLAAGDELEHVDLVESAIAENKDSAMARLSGVGCDRQDLGGHRTELGRSQ